MIIEQIRNATLKITYGGITFLVDPWLQDKGTGFSASTIRPEMANLKSPRNNLPFTPEKIIDGVDYCLVSHVHPDHFTSDYLPKDIKILAANTHDLDKIKKQGFINVFVLSEEKNKVDDVEIKKTPAIHGDNEEIALKMGEVSGFLLTGKEKSLYIAGDTVFCKEIEEFLKQYKPNVIILNCAEATLPNGRLIMNLEDIKAVCDLCPDAKVILTHLDSVNHALLTSTDVRKFVQENHLKNAIVPQNGECLEY